MVGQLRWRYLKSRAFYTILLNPLYDQMHNINSCYFSWRI